MTEQERANKVREVLAQYEEGAITYIEFVAWVNGTVTDEDRAQYNQYNHTSSEDNHMSENLPDQENPEILTLTISELDELVQDCSLQAYIENWLDEQLLSHNACDTQFKLVSVEHFNVDSTGHREHYVNIHVWANSYEFYGGLTDEDNYREISENV